MGIFGALASLGDLGEQIGEAKDARQRDAAARAKEMLTAQIQKQNQQFAANRDKREQGTFDTAQAKAKQPKILDTITSQGKVFNKLQYPDGTIHYEEAKGAPVPDTNLDAEYQTYSKIFGADEAQKMMAKKLLGANASQYETKIGKNGDYVYLPKDPSSGLPVVDSKVPARVPHTGVTVIPPSDSSVPALAAMWASSGVKPPAKYQAAVEQYMQQNGLKPSGATALSPAATRALSETKPVIDQVDKLIAKIDKLGLDKNNTPGYLLQDKLKYMVGMASDPNSLGGEIANLSLGSLVEAASALKGTSRNWAALEVALKHTPSWSDSPEMIKHKLQTIKDRLQDVVKETETYGTKSGVPNLSGSPQTPQGGNDSTIVVTQQDLDEE